MNNKKLPPRNYYLYAFRSGFYPMFLFLYLTPIIIGLIYLSSEEQSSEPLAIYFFGFAIIVNFFIAKYLAHRYNHYPIRIRFNDQKINIDIFTRDLNTIKESLDYDLDDLSHFYNLGLSNQKFKLLFKRGRNFKICKSQWRGKDNDFDELVEDFRTHLKTLKVLGKEHKIEYYSFYTGHWATLLGVLSLVGLLVGFGLLISLPFSDDFNWIQLKLPIGIIVASLIYIIRYAQEQNRNNSDN